MLRAARSPENAVRRSKIRNLAVNHCHDTGQVRALLCTPCHQGIGCYQEDPKLLAKVIESSRAQARRKPPEEFSSES